GRPYLDGIAMLPIPREIERLDREGRRLARPIVAAGGIPSATPARAARRLRAALDRVNAIGEQVNGWVRRTTERLLDEEKVPVVLGGDHSVPFGAIAAAA